MLMLVAIINLPSVRKLNANRWNTAANVKALPSPNVLESDAPLRKSSGNNLVTAQLIRVNSQLPINPLMKCGKHGAGAAPYPQELRHRHRRLPLAAMMTSKFHGRSKLKAPWRLPG